MLGGGSFTTQNQVLPGTYINFMSAARSIPMLSDRGIVAVPLILNWGAENVVFEVSAESFADKCLSVFGYAYDAAEMIDLREIFQNASKGVFYRLNGGEKATNKFASARCTGSRGNALTTVISANVDDAASFDVKTLLSGKVIDLQTVKTMGELKGNDYVEFKNDAVIELTVGTPLAGGTTVSEVTGTEYSDFLTAMESYSFHVLCCPSTEESVKALFAAYTKRMRDEAGIKFQAVMYRKQDADYEGIISVENKAAEKEQGLIYWTAGAEAACAVNKTNENRKYDGEYTVETAYSQNQLVEGIKTGKYMFHKVGDDIRVLMDRNTLTSFTEEKGEDFSSNQTIRVLDQIGNDVASLFNTRYLGSIPNDDSGRVALWNDIVSYGKQMSTIRAIEVIDSASITVAKGDSKRSVVVNFPVEPVNCMSQLYMTVIVS